MYNNILQLQSQAKPESQVSIDVTTDILADLPTFRLIDNRNHLFKDPDQAFNRGAFQRINADSIDLPDPRPPVNPDNSNFWIKSLPPFLQDAFRNEARTYFINPLIEYVELEHKAGTLPAPQIHASQDQYEQLLNKAEKAGMLYWTVVQEEDPAYTELANKIQMTLFAVSKSSSRSRLISWPRVQNAALPQPPYTSLPDPSMFEAIAIKGSSPSAFYLDVSNMFHNIFLPAWMAELFPMKPIELQRLSLETRTRLATRMNLNNYQAHTMLRPCQTTMPMGFKWSVYIGHNFESNALHRVFELFKSSKLAPPSLTSLTRLRREEAPFILTQQTPLLMHIIDEVAALAVDWTPQAVKLWYRLSRRMLNLDHLPTSMAKSCQEDEVETQRIDFIGCTWDLQRMTIQPAPDKLQRVVKQVHLFLQAKKIGVHSWKRILGRLVWLATLNRPLLACTQHVLKAASTVTLDDTIDIDEASKREVRTLVALLPLARVHTGTPLQTLLIAFDASQTAGAVTYTCITAELAARLWRQAQREKFTPPPEPRMNLEAVNEAVRNFRWRKAFIHDWRKVEHINMLEASTAVLALEWATRSGAQNSRLLMLTDSLVTLGALHKGRSSAPGLLVRCRRFGALALAHDLRVTFAYVRSEDNPADRYKRLSKRDTGNDFSRTNLEHIRSA